MPERVASPTPGQDRLIAFLAVLSVVVLMSVSTMTMARIGWNYDMTGGAGLTRFHPVTFLILLTFLLMLLRDGNPLASFLAALRQDARLALFLMGWFVLFYVTVAVQRLPAASPVDTFFLPFLLLLVVDRLDASTRRLIVFIIHLAFIANAALGIVEFVSGFRLTPFVVSGKEMPWDWRSTALFGHPLGNALMTGCYAICLMAGGGRELKGLFRFGVIGLQFAAMIAFGGRASLVLLLAAGALAVGWHMMCFLAGRRVNMLYMALIGLLGPVLLSGLFVLIDSGFFDRLLERFVNDGGSARTRLVMVDMFSEFSWTELLFGPPQDRLAHAVNLYGLEYGIESMWVAFIYYLGIIPSLLFGIGMVFFLLALADRCDKRVWLVLLYFFLVNSGFLGLAGKTTLFANLTLLLLMMFPAARPSPARWQGLGRASQPPAGAVPC